MRSMSDVVTASPATQSPTIVAMGQRVASRVDLHDDRVHAVVDLPPLLRLFADKIRAKLAKDGPKLLA